MERFKLEIEPLNRRKPYRPVYAEIHRDGLVYVYANDKNDIEMTELEARRLMFTIKLGIVNREQVRAWYRFVKPFIRNLRRGWDKVEIFIGYIGSLSYYGEDNLERIKYAAYERSYKCAPVSTNRF